MPAIDAVADSGSRWRVSLVQEPEVVPPQQFEDELTWIAEGGQTGFRRTGVDSVDPVDGLSNDDFALPCGDDVAVPGDFRTVGEFGNESFRVAGDDDRRLVDRARLAADVTNEGERAVAGASQARRRSIEGVVVQKRSPASSSMRK